MQRRRQHPMPHGLDHLDHPSHPSSGLGMTHIRFDRPQPQRPILRRDPAHKSPTIACASIGSPNTVPVPWASTTSTSAGTQTRTGQRRPDHPLLGGPIRGGQPIRGPVLIDRATPNHRQHRMPLTAGIGKPLQQHQTRALRKTRPISRQQQTTYTAHPPPTPAAGKTPPKRVGRGHHRHPAGQRHRTLTTTQRLTRLMHRHQRRRTRRIHRHRRPLQTEHIRNPPDTTLAAVPVTRYPSTSAQSRQQRHTGTTSPRRRPRFRCPATTADQSRPTRRSPTRSPTTTAAEDPSPTPHAEKSRKTPHQNPPPPQQTHPYGYTHCPPDQDRDHKAPPHPNPDPTGNPDITSRPKHHLPQTIRAIHPTRIPTPHPHHRHRLIDPAAHAPGRHRVW